MYALKIDSDGVIADFNGLVSSLVSDTTDKRAVWKAVHRYNADVAPFFESLPIMKDAHLLVRFAVANFDSVEILTATGRTPEDAGQQKINWYKKHFPHLKVTYVGRSSEKAQFATPTTILVDDRDASIAPWVEAGGIGILHTSVPDTIAQLRKFIK